MSFEFIITLIISVISLVVAGITLSVAIMTYKVNDKAKKIADSMNNRDIDRYNQEVDAKAREFISKYNMKQTEFDIPKISKIDLCVIAYMFNPMHSYRDTIYTDFNNLSIDVKNKVLELRKAKLEINNTNNFYFYTGLINITKQNYPQLLGLIENNFDTTIFNIFVRNGYIGQDIIQDDIIYQNKNQNIEKNQENLIRHTKSFILQSFKNDFFEELINNFYNNNNNDDYYSSIYYSYKLCIIVQQICIYSISKSNDIDKTKFIQIIDKYIKHHGLDWFNPNFTYEDLFLLTIFIWYICNNKNIISRFIL